MSQPIPPQAQLMDMLFAFAISRSISVAAQFGIADQLKEGAQSAEELAATLKLYPRSLYRMMRALAGAGVFHEDEEKRFSLTPLSELLRSDVPETMRDFARFIADDVGYKTWAALDYSVKTGQRAFDHEYGAFYFDWLGEHPDKGKVFNDAMTSLSAGAAAAIIVGYDFTGINKLVDVGGGHGFLLAGILQKYPQLYGVLFDAPNVVAQADSLLAAHGVADRCETAGGSFFESVPAGGDAYILKHIIHDWSDDECVTILQHCHRAMADKGKVLMAEMVLPAPNVPFPGKNLDLEMLLFMTGGERTADEYRALLDRAGFELTRIVPTPSPYSVIEGIKK